MKTSMFMKSMGSRFFVATLFFALFLQVGISTTFADSMVRTVQEALVEKGFDPGAIDGIWGSRTKAALMKFQESAGLTASGEIDDQTKSSLLSSSMSAPKAAMSSAPMPTTPAFSEDDTGPDAGDGEIAWGRHKG
jgi:peptidoglycan hydrolase-like protein with peptidoglycan-binding domain